MKLVLTLMILSIITLSIDNINAHAELKEVKNGICSNR